MPTIDVVRTDEVLAAVKMRGPIIPLGIRKILGKGDSITIGAALADLTQRKHVKVTAVKQGGSPFYYVEGQEAKLEICGQFLNEKDRRTFDRLRVQKVIRDKTQDPLTRVSLRQIRDFSKPVQFTFEGEEELFWKWYMTTDEQAYEAINIMLGLKKPEPVPEPKIEEPKQEPPVQTAPQQVQHQEPQRQPEPEKPKTQKTEPKQKHERQAALAESPDTEPITEIDEDFFTKLKKYFDKNNIRIIEINIIRKNSEYDLVIQMSTPFGSAQYFCKAKNKKKSSDGDLSSAYLQGQNRRLPTIYLTTGEVAKKAKEKATTDYKGMLIKEM